MSKFQEQRIRELENEKVNNPIKIPANSDLNNYTTPGFYYCPSSSEAATIANKANNYAFSLSVEKHAGIKQTFTQYQPASPKTWVRNYYSGTWGEWISDGPIIITSMGEEFQTGRTIEGRKEYGKRVSLGALPNSVSKTVKTGLSNISLTKPLLGYMKNTTNNSTTNIPFTDGSKNITFTLNPTTGDIYIYTNSDYSSWNGVVEVYYVKN